MLAVSVSDSTDGSRAIVAVVNEPVVVVVTTAAMVHPW